MGPLWARPCGGPQAGYRVWPMCRPRGYCRSLLVCRAYARMCACSRAPAGIAGRQACVRHGVHAHVREGLHVTREREQAGTGVVLTRARWHAVSVASVRPSKRLPLGRAIPQTLRQLPRLNKQPVTNAAVRGGLQSPHSPPPDACASATRNTSPAAAAATAARAAGSAEAKVLEKGWNSGGNGGTAGEAELVLALCGGRRRRDEAMRAEA